MAGELAAVAAPELAASGAGREAATEKATAVELSWAEVRGAGAAREPSCRPSRSGWQRWVQADRAQTGSDSRDEEGLGVATR